MTWAGAVFGDQFVADFRVAQPLLLEFTCKQRAIHADRATRRMIILIATVQALMADGVAIAETWQLRESLRNLLGHLISFSHLSRELFRRQRRLQTLQVLWLGEMGRDRARRRLGRSLRLMLLRGVVILRTIAGRQRRRQAYDQCYCGNDSLFASHNTFLFNSTVVVK